MSEPAAAAVFSSHAPDYDASRRRLVPPYDEFYGTVAEVCRRLRGGVRSVLDLGAGTGLLGAEILRVCPDAELVLLDGSEAMLCEARQRLGSAVRAVHIGDMAGALPMGSFDAVVSALAIHHLSDSDKRRLNERVWERLRPGGVFVNAEQVSAPSPALTAVYEDVWAQQCRGRGASERELDGARERMRQDRCADVASQLGWLHEAGFASADCIYKSWRFAVLAAWKEEA